MHVRSIVISSLQSCSQLFWGMHTHSFQTNQNHPHMEGYFKYYQTLNPKVQRPPRLVVCVHHSKQLQRRRFKSWNTIDQTSIYIPYCFQSAIVGKGGNVGWECVDPCGGIKPKSWMVVKEDVCMQATVQYGVQLIHLAVSNRTAVFKMLYLKSKCSLGWDLVLVKFWKSIKIPREKKLTKPQKTST